MKRKPIKGEILYDLNVGNAARGTGQALKPVIVKSVGRKYFTCELVEGSWRNPTQYQIESWRENTKYSEGHRLYESIQEWEDEKEVRSLRAEFRKLFDYFGKCDISLKKLRAMKRILDEEESK